MKCTNCGAENNTGSRFCNDCGMPMHDNDGNSNLPPSTSTNNPVRNFNKRKTGLIISLIIIGIAVITVVALIINFSSGNSIKGDWYNTTLGQVIGFRDNGEAIIKTVEGSFAGQYEYNEKEGNGIITTEGLTFMFVAAKGSMDVYDQQGNSNVFLKAGNGFDVQSIVATPTQTLAVATPEATVELTSTPVTELTATPSTTPSPTLPAAQTATPTPTAVISSTPTVEPVMTFYFPQMSLMPLVTQGLQINPGMFSILSRIDVLGKWNNQVYGVIEFFSDDTFTHITNNITYTGTYSYDNAGDCGTLQYDSSFITLDFTVDVNAETMDVNSFIFTKDDNP